MNSRFAGRTILAAAVTVASLTLASAANAAVLTYGFVSTGSNPPGFTGVGSITLNLPTVSSGTFGPVPGTAGTYITPAAATATADVAAFSFSWGNGAAVDLTSLTSLAVGGGGWTSAFNATAGGEILANSWTLSGTSVPPGVTGIYQISSNGTTGSNGTNSVQFGALTDFGYWKLQSVSAVPLPAALWLFGSGLAGLFGAARRRAA
jgi:hypothetical protein